MDKYPLAKEFIRKNLISDDQMAHFEKEIQKRQELNADEQLMEPQLEHVLFDLVLAKRCAVEAKDNDSSLAQAKTITQDCIFQILQIEELLGMAGLQDILYHTVHRKEQEVQRQMKMDQDLAEHEDQQSTILESRDIIQEFRKQQASKKGAEIKLASLEERLDQTDRELAIILRSMTDNRNKKIVSILQMSKLTNELAEQLNNSNFFKTDATGGHIDINEDGHSKPFTDNTSPFQSASDFLSNFISENIGLDDNEVRASLNSKKDKTKKLETPMRSILANRREDEYVATKQVRFSPYLKINHIKKEKSEIQDWLSHSGKTDDQNGELEEDDKEIEETDEDSEEVLAKASAEASDEDLDVEIEAEDEAPHMEVKIEMSNEVLDPKQDGYVEKSGSEMEESVSDEKESGGEASGEEDPDKPQIIRVDILPPIRNIFSIDDIPTTSTGALNQFTASQLIKFGSYFSANQPPPAKRLKVNEDEIQMAQPMPEFFEHPSSTDNNVDDQSLLFSSPHNNFDNDYLLSFSDDNDPAPAGSSYIL